MAKDRQPMPNARGRGPESRGDDDNLRHLQPPHPSRGHFNGTGQKYIYIYIYMYIYMYIYIHLYIYININIYV